MKWQPIETAPKDRQILAFGDGEMAVVEWYESYWTGYYEGVTPIKDPTHWMELPEFPE